MRVQSHVSEENFKALTDIVDFALANLDVCYVVTFQEGDSYECQWVNGEYVDNEEEVGSSAYEEWYELDFAARRVIRPGQNKDPRYDYISISEKHMPRSVTCGDVVLYNAEELSGGEIAH
jgi:hypothetical protein